MTNTNNILSIATFTTPEGAGVEVTTAVCTNQLLNIKVSKGGFEPGSTRFSAEFPITATRRAIEDSIFKITLLSHQRNSNVAVH